MESSQYYDEKMMSKSGDIKVNRLDETDRKCQYNAYTVEIGDNKVLTITTSCPTTAVKWLKEVLKAGNTKKGALIVGICVDGPKRGWQMRNKLVQICTGSNCLILRLSLKDDSYMIERMSSVLKTLKEFFESNKVFVVAAPPDGDNADSGMNSVKALKDEYGIEMANAVETVNDEALARKAKEIRVSTWPEKEKSWYIEHWPIRYYDEVIFTDKRVELCTLKTYLCFLIGNESVDLEHFASASGKKKKNRKNK